MTRFFERSKVKEPVSTNRMDVSILTSVGEEHPVGRSFLIEDEQQQLAARSKATFVTL
jgi:hypothetical protein